jgi:hypothetical protein
MPMSVFGSSISGTQGALSAQADLSAESNLQKSSYHANTLLVGHDRPMMEKTALKVYEQLRWRTLESQLEDNTRCSRLSGHFFSTACLQCPVS